MPSRPRALPVMLILGLALLGVGALCWRLGTPSPVADRPVSGPPWRHGSPDARFTLVLYADLECPHCQAYYPQLRQWVDAHPDVNLQWHHLPLAEHEPAASRQAVLAECAGQTGGPAAFWSAVTWIYAHTRGDGQGVADPAAYPAASPALQTCLEGNEAARWVRAQAREAAAAGIRATPSLRLIDHPSGQSVVLAGPVQGDTLLSALDLLSGSTAPRPPSSRMPADVVGDMPR